MPRLDNSHQEVIEWFGLNFDPEDPGATPPVDVCADCAEGMWEPEQAGVDHPPYEEEGGYICCECGVELTGDDD